MTPVMASRITRTTGSKTKMIHMCVTMRPAIWKASAETSVRGSNRLAWISLRRSDSRSFAVCCCACSLASRVRRRPARISAHSSLSARPGYWDHFSSSNVVAPCSPRRFARISMQIVLSAQVGSFAHLSRSCIGAHSSSAGVFMARIISPRAPCRACSEFRESLPPMRERGATGIDSPFTGFEHVNRTPR